MKEIYPSFLTPQSKPFDPIKLAHKTEEIACRGKSRKYTDFYCTGVYGGISTGYTVGCCLRCVFCWVDWSRDFPFNFGKFYSAEQAFNNLMQNAQKKKVLKLRISGGEPTLCPEHLLSLLELVNTTPYLFILETNGILFGNDPEYVNKLKKFRNIHIRVSLKAGTPEGFEKRTGAKGVFYELPFKAVENLKKARLNFHVAAMTDRRLMPPEERNLLIQKLKSIGYDDYLEEEICDPYPTAVIRLEKANFKLW
ncbi:radical SAM protein [Candidatus Aminicenantes bacterium AH-873-B07]|nr:radical SAM protein [Candidatus Aminicenantes bacterium AH-873-B07]